VPSTGGGRDVPASRLLHLASLLRPRWKALAAALLAVLVETGADVLEPWPIKVVVDNVLNSKALRPGLAAVVLRLFGDSKSAVLEFALVAIMVIAIVGALASFVKTYLTMSVGHWIAHDLRRLVYQRIQRLSLAEHVTSRRGDLVTRITSDIDAVQDFITTAMLGVVVSSLTLVGMVGVMLYVNWRFTLIGLSITPLLGAVVYSYTRRIKKATRRVKKQEAELTSSVAEVLSAIHVVQAFAREDYQAREFDWESRQAVGLGLEARAMKAKLPPIVDVIVAAGTCLVLGYGAHLALSGRLTTGVLVVLLLYLGKTYKPIRDLSKMTNSFTKATVSYERIQEVLQAESAVRDLPAARVAPPFRGLIELEQVTARYTGERPILRDVSLRIEPGQVVAIVGSSGAGKTTIASLIPRFLDPASGCVRIDGTDVREYTLKSLRDQFSFVLQDTLLFRASIWENIAYGRHDAEPEDTVQAAMLANAHEFITKLPDGYATLVGERGMTLSGGERQRIAIARALVRDSPIVILDEPTTGLDAAAEQAVVEALHRLMQGRTCIVIAHNLGTIRKADMIVVVKNAEIVERGTHDSLLARGGAYAELYSLQRLGSM
jgi:subfamily B ATP-binding cassette protein MsbA